MHMHSCPVTPTTCPHRVHVMLLLLPLPGSHR